MDGVRIGHRPLTIMHRQDKRYSYYYETKNEGEERDKREGRDVKRKASTCRRNANSRRKTPTRAEPMK